MLPLNLDTQIDPSIFRKMFLKLLFPLILFYSVSYLGAAVSAYIVGNYLPPASMSAFGLCLPILKCILVVSVSISSGFGIVSSKAMGRGDICYLARALFISLILIVISSLFLFIVFGFFGQNVVHLFGMQDEAISQEATAYFKGISCGIFPIILNFTFIIFLQLGNETSHTMISLIIQFAVNVVAMLFFTFSLHCGLLGIGLSTSIGAYSSMLYLTLCYFFKKNLIRPLPCTSVKGILKDILWAGFPSSFLILVSCIRDIFIIYRLTKYGAEGLAASAIAQTAIIIIYSCCSGVSDACTILSGLIIGERDRKMLEKAFNCLIRYSIIIGFSLNIAHLLFAEKLTVLFGAEGTTFSYTLFSISCYAIAFFFYDISLVVTCVYQSLGRISTVLLIQFMGSIIFPIVTICTLESFFRVYGIFSFIIFSEILELIFILLICRIKNGHFPKNAADFLWLDKNFKEIEGISISITSFEEAIGLSQKIETFCLSHGIQQKTAYKAALCLEEITMNIIKYGFRAERNTIDIFFYVEKGTVHMRIRDNGIPFDPHSKLKMHTPDPIDPCKNIGIRMVSDIAKEMTYQTTFGMNTLNIIL